MISVVMSVYNSEKYLNEAIESILTQTYTNFEFIIINDGSTDASLDIINDYISKDNRIVLVNRENKGLPFSLNEGIALAKGEYIARMDADDISLSNRLEKQLQFMKRNKVDICGGYVETFGGKSNKILVYPLSDHEIRFLLISMTPFAHPSVLIRKEVFKDIKYTNYETAQDYDLWCQIANKGFKMANLDSIILKYRIHSEQISVKKRKLQKEITYTVSQKYIENNNYSEYDSLLKLSERRQSINYEKAYRLFSDLIQISKDTQVSNNIVRSLIRFIFRTLSPMNISIGRAYFKSIKRIDTDIKGDIFVFIQAFFRLNNNSKIYVWLLNKVK